MSCNLLINRDIFIYNIYGLSNKGYVYSSKMAQIQAPICNFAHIYTHLFLFGKRVPMAFQLLPR
ncbi:unnamed protein product [Coffea canephora]|uniref:DH200=94 genomic scaffold, scaffold_164 n=1 Tax=Coffea canephora TaxID=49390 RepID=A0A068VA97_COFCA|nr:unnamed protein product [Coffea canephora]